MPESGHRLATFNRGEGIELRVNLAEYNGRPYLSLRVWERTNGQWLPVKGKGCSVRMSEAAELAKVLDLAVTRPTYVPPRHTRPEPRDMSQPLPTVSPSSTPFNECGGEHE